MLDLYEAVWNDSELRNTIALLGCWWC